MRPLLDHPFLSSRLFFPRPFSPDEPWLVHANGETLQCWRDDEEAGDWGLLFFHGNGEVVDDYLFWLPKMLRARGVRLFLGEYRGYGGSSGEATLCGILDDIPEIVEATGLSPRRLVVFGRSLGALYAVEAVRAFPSIAGLILESGVADLLERILVRATPSDLGTTDEGLKEAVALHFDQEKKLSVFGGEALVLHTRGDSLVSHRHGKLLAEWSRGRLVSLPQGGHNNAMAANTDQYWQEIDDFLERLRARG